MIKYLYKRKQRKLDLLTSTVSYIHVICKVNQQKIVTCSYYD